MTLLRREGIDNMYSNKYFFVLFPPWSFSFNGQTFKYVYPEELNKIYLKLN